MIVLNRVSLEYPLVGHLSHSLQREVYHCVGGLLHRKGKRGGVTALSDISLEARPGERIGIIGHNGSGKTTLLRIMAGVYPPTSGTVRIDGRVNALTDITLGMDENATGRKNIVFRLIFMGYTMRESLGAMEEIIAFSELGDFIDLPVRTYSSGMFLRLAFAVSTHFTPDILLLDEVIGAGDLAFQAKAQERVKSLFAKSRIMVLSAHDLGAVRAYCTRAIVLHKGAIAAEGTPDAMIETYRDLTLHEREIEENQ